MLKSIPQCIVKEFLTYYTRNCKAFLKKMLCKIVAHIYKTIQKIVAVVKKSCKMHGK